jgi:hypothetical protein
MKSLHFFVFLSVAALLFGTSCERHPASQTIPSSEEKQVFPSKEADEKK